MWHLSPWVPVTGRCCQNFGKKIHGDTFPFILEASIGLRNSLSVTCRRSDPGHDNAKALFSAYEGSSAKNNSIACLVTLLLLSQSPSPKSTGWDSERGNTKFIFIWNPHHIFWTSPILSWFCIQSINSHLTYCRK